MLESPAMNETNGLVETSAGRIYARRFRPDGSMGASSLPRLVLIHGYIVSQHYFRAVVPELARRFEVVTLDLPGHGESDRPAPARFTYDQAHLADVVDEALGKLGVERAHVWGHSMGGGVALALAGRHPRRVERLVLEDAAGYAVPMPLLGRVALLPGIGRLLFQHAYTKRDLRQHLRTVHRNPDVCPDEDVDFFWERFNRPGARDALHACLRMLATLPANNPFAASVRAPTLIVWGDGDPTVPPSFGPRLAAAIDGARLVVIPECGHSPHEERPEATLAAVLPFLLGEGASGVGAAATEGAHGATS